MKKFRLLPLIVLLSLAGCGAVNQAIAQYDVVLSSVSAPEDIKSEFSAESVKIISDNDKKAYKYEDDFIVISTYYDGYTVQFKLTNKTKSTIKLNWDDFALIDTEGQSHRVMHKGIKYVDKNSPQAPTSVPRGATVSELLQPVDFTWFDSFLNMWRTRYIVPCVYKDKEHMAKNANENIGKSFQVLMPIEIEKKTNEYIFEFKVADWLNK